ncbi:hypothetical protein [Halarchaeum nitratireducens]|uniref:Uncharacterized protein n=1 Tax=Halarchaeum nitratireducens TaxID=489913 RepID=A0A830G949_9EURY|nr:hypothetical protein [Halarchaeum nitratireducens]GGN09817.1 hypothetical protein GCM10009021_06830 [Halarchaeum nitratireducens]
MTGHTRSADRIAMWLGGGLVLLGTAGLGLAGTFVGERAWLSVDVRGTLVVLGLAVLACYAVYRAVAGDFVSPR